VTVVVSVVVTAVRAAASGLTPPIVAETPERPGIGDAATPATA
jgi:hypothetical protein